MPKKVPPSKSLFSEQYDHFLRLLREARTKAGLTQQEAATRLKRPQSFVSKCESGERRVDVVEFVKFCQVYGIKPIGLFRKLLEI
jgi:transcriptional regulator with XRE-family HTH domain